MGDQGKWKSQTHNEVHNCWDSTVSTLRIIRLLDLYPPQCSKKPKKYEVLSTGYFLKFCQLHVSVIRLKGGRKVEGIYLHWAGQKLISITWAWPRFNDDECDHWETTVYSWTHKILRPLHNRHVCIIKDTKSESVRMFTPSLINNFYWFKCYCMERHIDMITF